MIFNFLKILIFGACVFFYDITSKNCHQYEYYSLNKVRHKVLSLSDYFVSVQSFEGDEKVNILYKDYHGLLDILKVQSLGSLAGQDQNHILGKCL